MRDTRTIWNPVTAVAACAAVILGLVAACTGSPATLALQPDFEVSTATGLAGVSIRESLPGMTRSQSVDAVKAGMERAALGRVTVQPLQQPFPPTRIVWHVDGTASRGISRLLVNVFSGSTPYDYEQEGVGSEPQIMTSSAIESMSQRLLADLAKHFFNRQP